MNPLHPPDPLGMPFPQMADWFFNRYLVTALSFGQSAKSLVMRGLRSFYRSPVSGRLEMGREPLCGKIGSLFQGSGLAK
jgi:hypothetical protein